MDKKEKESLKPKTRRAFLKRFEEQNDLSDPYHDAEPEIKEAAHRIIQILKKEDFTYTEAYASLQYAYNKLKFESNFVKLPKD